MVFRGRLAKRVQQPGEKLTDFLGEFLKLALKAYPADSEDVREHMVVRGFLGGTCNTQVRLDLGKTLPKIEKKAQTLQEEMLHWEAVTRIGKGHRVSALVPDSTSRLVYCLIEMVEDWKAQNESRKGARIGRRISGDWDGQRSKSFSSMRSTSRPEHDRSIGRDGTAHDAEYLHQKLGSLLAVWKVEEQWTVGRQPQV